jgi:hypothetical protein
MATVTRIVIMEGTMATDVIVTATGRITDRRAGGAARRSNQGKTLVVTLGIAGTFIPT